MSGESENKDLLGLAFKKSFKGSVSNEDTVGSLPTGIEAPKKTLKSVMSYPHMNQGFQKAIKKRAQEIGIKDDEQGLLWIAENSLKDPLPENWIEAATEDNYIYYFNEITGESLWQHPALERYKKQYRDIVGAKKQITEESTSGVKESKEGKRTPPAKHGNSNTKDAKTLEAKRSSNSLKSNTSKKSTGTNRSNLSNSRGRDEEDEEDDISRMDNNSLSGNSLDGGSVIEVHDLKDLRVDDSRDNRDSKGLKKINSAASMRSQVSQLSQLTNSGKRKDEPVDHNASNLSMIDGMGSLAAQAAGDIAEGRDPADYWYEKYEMLNQEKKRLETRMASIEEGVTVVVGKESQMLNEKYILSTACKENALRLQKTNQRAITILGDNGFDKSKLKEVVTVERRGHHEEEKGESKNDTESKIDSTSLEKFTTQSIKLIDFLASADFQDNVDDRGYTRSWQGVSKRIAEEMQACFPSFQSKKSSQHLKDDNSLVGIDLAEEVKRDESPAEKEAREAKEKEANQLNLKHRLDALSQIIVAFGEYLPVNQRSYMAPLVKHICQQAPGSTMVPLEAISASMRDLHQNYRAEGNNIGPLSTTNKAEEAHMEQIRNFLEIDSPKNVSLIRQDLSKERAESAAWKDKYEKIKASYDTMNSKFIGMEAKVEESRSREEAMLNKFSSITKSIDEMKESQQAYFEKVQSSGISEEGKEGDTKTVSKKTAVKNNNGISSGDIKSLVDKLANMSTEVDIANKRALNAERRCKEMMESEKKHKTEDIPALKEEINNRTKEVTDLQSKSIELETVAKNMHSDLQKSLQTSARWEAEALDLRKQLKNANDNIKVEEINLTLQNKLKDETARTKNLENSISTQKHEMDRLKKQAENMYKTSEKFKAKEAQYIQETESNMKEITHLRSEVERLQNENAHLGSRGDELKRMSAILNEKILDLQGNIRVFCRVRPALPFENVSYDQFQQFADFPEYNTLYFNEHTYEFDRVFGPQNTQSEVYEEVLPAIRTVMNGARLCIFAYGQTGAGKTHTMMGMDNRAHDHQYAEDYQQYHYADEEAYQYSEYGQEYNQQQQQDYYGTDVTKQQEQQQAQATHDGFYQMGDLGLNTGKDRKGINMRALESIFAYSTLENHQVSTTVRISMLEVYNEKVIDLLSSDNVSADGKQLDAADIVGLEVRLGKGGSSYVEGLTGWNAETLEETLALIERGHANRSMTSNDINEHSSRSHLAIIVKVDRDNFITGQKSNGSLTLVDLAGSERLKASGASGARLREAQHVNKSLSSLGDVISALASKSKHVPYRNSKLTFLLQDSLQPHSRVLMFVNISPVPEYASEGTSSLSFASRCRQVQLGEARSQISYN
jgi:hypothetical protein